jgi:ribosomal protein L13
MHLLPTPASSSTRHRHKWHLVDAKGMVLGKVVTKVATLLQGKHKVSYVVTSTPATQLLYRAVVVSPVAKQSKGTNY